MSADGVRRPWRGLVALATAVVLVIALLLLRPGGPLNAGADEESEPAVVTAPVERATLVSQVRLSAQLGYGDPVPLPVADGVLTVLPAPGALLGIGEQVYEQEGRPVVLLRGERPMWRDLAAGVSDGPDVRQLEENLAELGFFDGDPDTRFDWRTREAVRAWQADLGLPRTGTVSPADVVVVDAPSIRISQVSARPGESGVSTGTYTETVLRATARLTSTQARELGVGDEVTVRLPSGEEIAATITTIDPGGEPTGEDGQVSSPSVVIEFADQEAVSAAGPVAVRVVVADDTEDEPTLVVPATALLATADGGYAVEVLDGGRIVRVPVEIGLAVDARVQILRSGPAIGGEGTAETADAGTGAGTGGRVLAEGDDVVIA